MDSLRKGTCIGAVMAIAMTAFLSLGSRAAQASLPNWTWMYQCEACDTAQKAMAAAIARQQTGSRVYVFSTASEKMYKFQVYYDYETRQWVADELPLEDAMVAAFQGMVKIKRIEPTYYTQAIHTITLNMRDVSPGSDPIAASIGGPDGSSEFSRMQMNFTNFLACSSCVERLSPLLAEILDTSFRLGSFGLDFMGKTVGGSLQFERFENTVYVQLCTAEGVCAKFSIMDNGNKVEFMGTWDDFGRGLKYPSPNDTANNRRFFGSGSSLDADNYTSRLRGEGIDIIGSFNQQDRWLVCAYTDGILTSCYWE